MNPVLAAWNAADQASAMEAMIACCGARRWAEAIVALRPIAETEELSVQADRIWGIMEESDWLEAFACHPRIGARRADHANVQSAAWSREEQSSTESAAKRVLAQLEADNLRYEQQFGFTYIVCATGKSTEEVISILKRRLESDRESELREAAEQQRQITQIRLEKWLTS